MSSHHEWCQSQVAQNQEALLAGDGCHPDEAKTLDDYLSNSIPVNEAAKQITVPVSREADPKAEVYRLWALLSTAMVELEDSNHLNKILHLLNEIQNLPSKTSGINWLSTLDFLNMWSDLYRLHLHGLDPWETEDLSDVRGAELRKRFRATGRAEASMYVQDVAGVPAQWVIEVIDLVNSARPGVDILLSKVQAWLQVGGTKLKGDHGVSEAQIERWQRSLAQLKGEDSPLSRRVRDWLGSVTGCCCEVAPWKA